MKFRKPSDALVPTPHLYVASGSHLDLEDVISMLREVISSGRRSDLDEQQRELTPNECSRIEYWQPTDTFAANDNKKKKKKRGGHFYLSFESVQDALVAK